MWPFDLEQLSYMAGHVSKPATKFEDPTRIRSWATSYNVSHWLPLKMRTRSLHMRRITWPVSKESKTITFLESPAPICLFSVELFGAKTTIKSRLRVSRPILYAFSTEKKLSKIGPKIGGFGVKGGYNFKYWFRDTQETHPCAEPRLLAYFACACLGCGRFEKPKKRKNSGDKRGSHNRACAKTKPVIRSM